MDLRPVNPTGIFIVIFLSGFAMVSSASSASANASQAMPVQFGDAGETEAVIDEIGRPDLLMSRPGEDDDLWYYQDLDSRGLNGDLTLVVDEDSGVIWEIYEGDTGKEKPRGSEVNWVDQQVTRVEELIDSVKKERNELDKRISVMTGLDGYFDRAEFLTTDITLGLGKGPGATRTDIVYDTRKEQLSFAFRMPF